MALTSHRGRPKGLPKTGGRKSGTRNKATDAEVGSLSDLARQHTAIAINRLVRVAQSSESDAAGVAAATAILDRGYGRPPQQLEVAGGAKPVELNITVEFVKPKGKV
jgi:hypothetical protein